MAEVVASKLKLLHLARIFERETDDDHGLTASQIIGKLAELGVNVERKTLYRDIDCLRSFGYNILKYNRAPVEYGLARSSSSCSWKSRVAKPYSTGARLYFRML